MCAPNLVSRAAAHGALLPLSSLSLSPIPVLHGPYQEDKVTKDVDDDRGKGEANEKREE